MYNYETELIHHGVKGMKWGVRRYQNPDGSLTAKGKKYNKWYNNNYMLGKPKITHPIKRHAFVQGRKIDAKINMDTDSKQWIKRERYTKTQKASSIAAIGAAGAAGAFFKNASNYATHANKVKSLGNLNNETVRSILSNSSAKYKKEAGKALIAGAAAVTLASIAMYNKRKFDNPHFSRSERAQLSYNAQKRGTLKKKQH